MDPLEVEISPRGTLRFNFRSETFKTIEDNVGSENARLYVLFIQSYLSLLLDSPTDTDKPYHVIQRFFKVLRNADPYELVIRYSSLAEELLATANITSDYTITGEFLDGMKDTPVFREYLHYYKTGDARCLRFLLSFLWFGKKMDFVNTDLETAAFRSWLEIERELEHLTIPVDLMESLRIIIAQISPRIDDSVFLPRHGPGYTAEGCLDPNDKLDILSLDVKSRYAFRANSFGRVGMDRVSIQPWLADASKKQVAKLRFVPKNVKTMRSICMEPSSRMFLQQEVSRWLVNTIHSTCLNRIVDLRDQGHNRHYAQCGSFSYSCDTIDLSAASDRLHVELVRSVFPKQILFYLLGTRTDDVDVSGAQNVRLHKFAPMGSALCFPVQCIVFSGITLLAYLMRFYGCAPSDSLPKDWYYLHHIDEFIRMMHDSPEEIKTDLLCPRVYGDDIICDYRTTDDILFLLTRFGLRVNTEKCFIGGSPFRESCGIFAYDGEDVTPFLFRVPAHKRRLDAKCLASIVSQANRAGDFGFHHLRSRLIHYISEQGVVGVKGDVKPYIPFTSDRDTFGIYTTNVLVPRFTRTNARYQRDEKKVMCIRSIVTNRRVSVHSEAYAYDQWMRARIHGGSNEINFSSSRIRPQVTRIKLGWTPV